jgi:hypothetical protein
VYLSSIHLFQYFLWPDTAQLKQLGSVERPGATNYVPSTVFNRLSVPAKDRTLDSLYTYNTLVFSQ